MSYDKQGRQLLTMNKFSKNGKQWSKPRVLKDIPDSILIGDELMVSIYLDNSNVHIVDAYFDCDFIINPTVDTSTFEVSGCSKRLFLRNDTLIVGFRPSEIGEHQFPEITLLTRDQDNIFRTLGYKFSYKVVEQIPPP